MLQNKTIAIIGGGNMGSAVAKGIVASGLMEAKNICITCKTDAKLGALAAEGFRTSTNNNEAVKDADIVIMAVKPYLVLGALEAIKADIKNEALLMSVATGISVAQLEGVMGEGRAVVRVMPNTAAAVRESVTALCVKNTTPDEEQMAVEIFSAMGLAMIVDEALMPAITALASCGIAHALRFIRAAMEAGIEMGLTSKQSAQIAAQTVKGAAELILKNGSHPEVEIDKVCTPKGVTITGINEMEHAGFSSAVIKGIMGSYNKIVK